MKIEHTPGPWKPVEFGGTQIGGGYDFEEAVCTMWDSKSARGIANARLIAAAPDMLDALKSCIPTNVSLTNRNIRDRHLVPLDVSMGDLRRIAAVIAKATGQ